MISADSLPDAGVVSVWAAWLNAPATVTSALRALLSPEEMRRADRFAFPHLTAKYEISHGVLRVLLSQLLKCSPRGLEFTYGHAGKPALCSDSRLRFNMSHSGNLAVYAFAVDCEIGIDVEEVRHTPDIEAIARHYFCGAEASGLLGIAGKQQQLDAFFHCWTRKESYIKATGDGLTAPLDLFQVTLTSDAPVRFVHIGNSAEDAAAWTLQHLEPCQGYIGAVAYRAPARKLDVHPPLPAQEYLELLRH